MEDDGADVKKLCDIKIRVQLVNKQHLLDDDDNVLKPRRSMTVSEIV